MEFQILGPLEVRHEGAEVALGAGKQRALLAILLIHANELVSSDRLIEELWPKPPRTAANALQVYVGKLRKALEPARTRGAADALLGLLSDLRASPHRCPECGNAVMAA